MKKLLLIPLLFTHNACSDLTRVDGDWFEAAGRSPGQFESDNQACNTQATDTIINNWSHSYDSPFDQNRAFNNVYGRCMAARHYKPRAYAENWLPS